MQMSFPDDIFDASDEHVADTIVRARKSWKTVKGKSEPVWPPHLEKSLVQALLQYKPNDSRYTRALGRFPKRNRFISDFIFEQTGVRRSPKQVGSRLQQLKDVTCGKQLLNHVASFSLGTHSVPATASMNSNMLDASIYHQDDSSSPDSPLAHLGLSFNTSGSASSPPASSHYSPNSPYGSPPITPQVRRLNVFITLEPGASSRRHGAPQPLQRFSGCLARPETVFALDTPSAPLVLADAEPSASFTSRDPIAAQSVTTVWVEAGQALSGRGSPADGLAAGGASACTSANVGLGLGVSMKKVHQHSQPLVCSQAPATMATAATQSFYSIDKIGEAQIGSSRHAQAERECFVYKTNLVDDAVWSMLRRERNLSRYTITQELICNFDNSAARRGETFLCITYHFQYASSLSSPASHSLGVHGPISPASSSSGSPSPVSASPSSFLHPHSFSQQAMQSRMGMQPQMPQLPQTQYGLHSHAYTQIPQLSVHAPGVQASGDIGLVNMKNYFRTQSQDNHANIMMSPGLGGGSPQGNYASVTTGMSPAPYTMQFGDLGLDIDVHGLRLSASPVDGHLGLNQSLL